MTKAEYEKDLRELLRMKVPAAERRTWETQDLFLFFVEHVDGKVRKPSWMKGDQWQAMKSTVRDLYGPSLSPFER